MKKQFVTLAVALALISGGGVVLAEHSPGQMEGHHQSPGATNESIHADVKKHQACSHCGMDRGKFAASRVLVSYTDGSSAGMCSVHCTATELKANKGKAVRVIEAADLNTKALVDVEKAAWVIGGSRKGVMTRTAKWAFALKDDAVAFIKKNGGKLATYKEVMMLVEKD